MKTFQQYILENEAISKESIKNIIFNALMLDGSKVNDKDMLNNNLSDFDSRKNILRSRAIMEMPAFEEIKKIINVDYQNFTIGSLADKIFELNSPIEKI